MIIIQNLCQVLKLDKDIEEKELIKSVLFDAFIIAKNFGIEQTNSKILLLDKNEKFCGCEDIQPELIEHIGNYIKTTYITDDEGNGIIIYQKENQLC